MTTILFSRSVMGTSERNVCSSCQTPGFIHLCKFIMKRSGFLLEFIFIFAGKHLLESKFAVLAWEDCTMNMRCGFVKMYIETNDILLTIFVTYETVHIPCPMLYFWHSVK